MITPSHFIISQLMMGNSPCYGPQPVLWPARCGLAAGALVYHKQNNEFLELILNIKLVHIEAFEKD